MDKAEEIAGKVGVINLAMEGLIGVVVDKVSDGILVVSKLFVITITVDSITLLDMKVETIVPVDSVDWGDIIVVATNQSEGLMPAVQWLAYSREN